MYLAGEETIRRWVKKGKKYIVKILDGCRHSYLKLVKKNTALHCCIERYLEDLKESPYIGEKPFANFPGCRSIHFGGNSYRIIYKVIEEQSEILILDIGHRSSSYIDLARRLGQGR